MSSGSRPRVTRLARVYLAHLLLVASFSSLSLEQRGEPSAQMAVHFRLLQREDTKEPA